MQIYNCIVYSCTRLYFTYIHAKTIIYRARICRLDQKQTKLNLASIQQIFKTTNLTLNFKSHFSPHIFPEFRKQGQMRYGEQQIRIFKTFKDNNQLTPEIRQHNQCHLITHIPFSPLYSFFIRQKHYLLPAMLGLSSQTSFPCSSLEGYSMFF